MNQNTRDLLIALAVLAAATVFVVYSCNQLNTSLMGIYP